MAVGLHLSLGSRVAQAYDSDTHYLLTYYLARKVGYSPEEARRIASANVSIEREVNTSTEPMQGKGISKAAQAPRINYHAFEDDSLLAVFVAGFAGRPLRHPSPEGALKLPHQWFSINSLLLSNAQNRSCQKLNGSRLLRIGAVR